MGNKFTAVVERDGKWHVARCPEIPGANGQGRSKKEALKSLADAVALILEDRLLERSEKFRTMIERARRGKTASLEGVRKKLRA